MVGSTSGSQGDIGRALGEEMRASLVNGKLPCAVAFQIAKKLKVGLKQVGDAANRLGIKISSCQLGCFP
jgi:hypothetical protein